MSRNLQQISGGSLVAPSYSPEPEEYRVDCDFETGLVSLSQDAERVAEPKAKAIKFSSASPAFKVVKATRRDTGTISRNTLAARRETRVETTTPIFKATNPTKSSTKTVPRKPPGAKCEAKVEKTEEPNTPSINPDLLHSDTDNDSECGTDDSSDSGTDDDSDSGHESKRGAIDPKTRSFVYPEGARRGKIYHCPTCTKIVRLKAGNIRRAHFAHKRSETPCTHYTVRPSESEEHKYAKRLLKRYLESHKSVVISHSCSYIDSEYPPFCIGDKYSKSEERLKLPKNGRVVLEYRDPEGKWIADLAVFDENDKLDFIVEVKKAHTTTTERPGKWYEVDSRDTITQIIRARKIGGVIELDELRQEHSWICNNCKLTKEAWASKLPVYPERIFGACLVCGGSGYAHKPVWIRRKPRKVCVTCFTKKTEVVKAKFWLSMPIGRR